MSLAPFNFYEKEVAMKLAYAPKRVHVLIWAWILFFGIILWPVEKLTGHRFFSEPRKEGEGDEDG